MKAKQLNRAIITISLIGVLLSTYALYVELLAELRPGYKALCDISEHASCSRVLTSKYGKGLGLVPEDSPFKVPNCVYGIIFYCIIILLRRNVRRVILGFVWYCVVMVRIACLVAGFSCMFSSGRANGVYRMLHAAPSCTIQICLLRLTRCIWYGYSSEFLQSPF